MNAAGATANMNGGGMGGGDTGGGDTGTGGTGGGDTGGGDTGPEEPTTYLCNDGGKVDVVGPCGTCCDDKGGLDPNQQF